MFENILKACSQFNTANKIETKSVRFSEQRVSAGIVLLPSSEVGQSLSVCVKLNRAQSGLTCCVIVPAQLDMGDLGPEGVGVKPSEKILYLLIFDSISWRTSVELISYTLFPHLLALREIEGDRFAKGVEASFAVRKFLADIEKFEPAILLITDVTLEVVLCRPDLTYEEFARCFDEAARLSEAIFGGEHYVFKPKMYSAKNSFKSRVIRISLSLLFPRS